MPCATTTTALLLFWWTSRLAAEALRAGWRRRRPAHTFTKSACVAAARRHQQAASTGTTEHGRRHCTALVVAPFDAQPHHLARRRQAAGQPDCSHWLRRRRTALLYHRRVARQCKDTLASPEWRTEGFCSTISTVGGVGGGALFYTKSGGIGSWPPCSTIHLHCCSMPPLRRCASRRAEIYLLINIGPAAWS